MSNIWTLAKLIKDIKSFVVSHWRRANDTFRLLITRKSFSLVKPAIKIAATLKWNLLLRSFITQYVIQFSSESRFSPCWCVALVSAKRELKNFNSERRKADMSDWKIYATFDIELQRNRWSLGRAWARNVRCERWSWKEINHEQSLSARGKTIIKPWNVRS